MDSGVKLAPAYHFYKDGAKVGEYVGSSYPALEVSHSEVDDTGKAAD